MKKYETQARNRKTENKRKNEPKIVAIFCPSIFENKEVPFLRLPDFFDLLDFLAGRFFLFRIVYGYEFVFLHSIYTVLRI